MHIGCDFWFLVMFGFMRWILCAWGLILYFGNFCSWNELLVLCCIWVYFIGFWWLFGVLDLKFEFWLVLWGEFDVYIEFDKLLVNFGSFLFYALIWCCINCFVYTLESFLERVLFMMFSEKWKLLFLVGCICLTNWSVIV